MVLIIVEDVLDAFPDQGKKGFETTHAGEFHHVWLSCC